MLRGRSQGQCELRTGMPAAHEHLFDDVHMAGSKLNMDTELKVAPGARCPIGGAYHGLTPSQDCF